MDHPKLIVEPLDAHASFKTKAYMALKQAIAQMDIYDHPEEIRLDERQLCEALGVSRTPIREAMALLEQEGFVRSMPRRGIFVVRKTKAQIVDMVVVWAALESMAARLVAQHATDDQIKALWRVLEDFSEADVGEHLTEYSDANIQFHQSIIRASGCALINELTENLFMHIRAIRKLTIRHDRRADRSILEHREIVRALEERDADRAERLVREHNLGLAEHIERNCDFLD